MAAVVHNQTGNTVPPTRDSKTDGGIGEKGRAARWSER